MDNINRILVGLRKGDRHTIMGRAERQQELKAILGEEFLFDIYPDFGSYHDDETEVLQALEEYSQEWWRQGLLCFINRLYLACITCMAFALETSLKYRLHSMNPNVGAKYDLKKCIGTCQSNKYQILPSMRNDSVVVAINGVLKSRDDIVHANIAFSRPESIVWSEGEEHEITGDIMQSVEEFKNLARKTILNTKRVIDYIITNKLGY